MGMRIRTKILVTGSNGYLARNIIDYLEERYGHFVTVIPLNRSNCDLLDRSSVNGFFNKYRYFDCVIHCAVVGGRQRPKFMGIPIGKRYENSKPTSHYVFPDLTKKQTIYQDDPLACYQNLLMFDNLMSNSNNFGMFINIASGAELDSELSKLPYGLSKKTISNIVNKNFTEYYNVYVWNVFNWNEESDRFIKANMIRYISNEPMIIYKNKLMDFYYMNDFLAIIQQIIFANTPELPHNIGATYSTKEHISLLMIANVINTLTIKKVPIEIMESGTANSYCNNDIRTINNEFTPTGLVGGIKEMYNMLNNPESHNVYYQKFTN